MVFQQIGKPDQGVEGLAQIMPDDGKQQICRPVQVFEFFMICLLARLFLLAGGDVLQPTG